MAKPRPMDEHRPRVLTWMLPSLGCTPFHSAVAPPAVVTNNSFLINGAIACRHSKRFIYLSLQHGAGEQQRDRSFRTIRQGYGSGDILFHFGRIAHDDIFDA